MVMTLLTRPKKSVATVTIATDGSGDYNCDGVDDQVQINAALNSLPATGGCVYMKEGNYVITDSIVVPSYVGLIGCGYSTRITCAAGSNFEMILCDNNDYLLIDNLSLYGGSVNPADAAMVGVSFGTTTYSKVSRCWTENCVAGIILADSERNIIELNHTYDNYYGIYMDNTTQDLISSNVIYSNDEDGVEIVGGTGTIVQNNTIAENIRFGIAWGEADNYYMTISNNNCYDNGTGAGNRGGMVGHRLYYSNIVGNNCSANGSVASTGFGIVLDNNCKYNTITGNNCSSNIEYGIFVDESNDEQNVISSNNCLNNNTQGIYNRGNNNVICNNIHNNAITDTGSNTQVFNNKEL